MLRRAFACTALAALAVATTHCGRSPELNRAEGGGGSSATSSPPPTTTSDGGASSGVTVGSSAGGGTGVVVIPPRYDTSEQGISQVTDAATRAGVKLLSVGYNQWAAIEQAPGTFDFSYLDGLLAATQDRGFEFALDVATPIALSEEMDLPADLELTSFEDATLAERYHAFLRATVQFAPPATRYLTLHTEGVTQFFGARPELRDGFCTFMAEAVEVLHQERPELLVGAYWRYEDDDEDLRECVTGSADYLGLAFVLNPPDDVLGDIPVILDTYLEAAGSQPVGLVEVGWPSAESFGSSEAQQSQFVGQVFAALSARSARLLFASYYTIFDEDREFASSWVNAYFPDMPEEDRESLIDWVCSLGMLRSDGTEKPAWGAFLEVTR